MPQPSSSMSKTLTSLCAGALWLACSAAQAVTCQNNLPPSNPDSIYTVPGDGTVTDARTGLVWKQCLEGQSGADCGTGSATNMTWAGALAHAESHSFAGQSDWRLPSVKELRSLVEDCRTLPSINDHVFKNAPSSYVWSGSPTVGSLNSARLVNFGNGGAEGSYRNNGYYLVRLVRGGQSFAPLPTTITASVPVVAPAPSGQANTFVFTVTLSRALAAGEYVALNFDDQNGGWYGEAQPGGQVRMACTGTTCTLERELDQPGLRAVRAGVFGGSGQAVGAYSASTTCTLAQCIAATAQPAEVGNPALSGSGSQLVRGVDVATGNYHLSVADLAVPGKGPDFVLMRAYNARTGKWTFNLDLRAAFAPDSQRRIEIGPREDGRTQTFFKDMDDQWYALNPGNFDQLAQAADGSLTLYTQGNLYYRFAAPDGLQAGRLQAIHDRDGNTLAFSHTANRVTGATDASGRPYTIARDGVGRIAQVADFAGRSVQYTWGSADMMADATNPNGQRTRYTYDANSKLATITDPRGNVQASMAYHASGVNAGRVSSVTDGAGTTWSYTYTTVADAQGQHGTGVNRPATNGVNNNVLFVIDDLRSRVLERVDAVSAGDFRRRYQFATAANAQRIAEMALVTRREQPSFATNGAHSATTFANDGTGNPLTVTAGGNGVASMTTESAWATVSGQANLTPLRSLRQPGVGTATQFDGFTAAGKPQTITNPLGDTSYRSYGAGGLLQSTKDARNATTSLQYDAQGRPTRVTNALSHATVTGYDALGRVTSQTDALGHATTLTYDANGNVLTVTDPQGGVTRHTYDASDNLASTTDPRGHTTTYGYDAANRKITETYTAGGQQRTRSFAYDAMGRLHRVTNEKGHSSETRFDARGNALQEVNPLSETITYTYDANGNVQSVTDAEGRKMEYVYDALGRKTMASDTLGNYEAYTYNAQGLLASKRDARGQTTRYSYDALGRMTQVQDADGATTLAAYDANGNLTSTTDRKGQTTRYDYDALNRMTRLTDATGRVWTFAYDANGNLTSRTTPTGATTHFTYDKLGRVLTASYPGGPAVAYTYDANGNRLTMADANGTSRYAYDERNRLTGMTDAFGNTVGWAYDAAGLLARLAYPGGASVAYAYDAAGRMASLTDWLGHTTTYTRDRSGAIKDIRYGNGTTVAMGYDNAGRLTGLVNSNAAGAVISSHSLTLDGVGNPTRATLDLPLLPTQLGQAAEMLYDASNRLTSVGGKAITHDTDGRLTGDASGTDPIEYAYNAQDQITRVSKAGAVADAYTYDGDGRRVARTRSGQTTRYVLDPTGGDLYRLLTETNASNAPQYHYVYGDSGLVAQIGGTSHRYYHFDQTGNTLALTNASGTVTDTYAYEPFGNTTAQGSSHNPFRFVGQHGVMDDGNGLHHMRARYYRPDLRRFVSLDALYGQVDDPMTLNRYQYVGGNPMVGVDPSGYKTMAENIDAHAANIETLRAAARNTRSAEKKSELLKRADRLQKLHYKLKFQFEDRLYEAYYVPGSFHPEAEEYSYSDSLLLALDASDLLCDLRQSYRPTIYQTFDEKLCKRYSAERFFVERTDWYLSGSMSQYHWREYRNAMNHAEQGRKSCVAALKKRGHSEKVVYKKCHNLFLNDFNNAYEGTPAGFSVRG